jgi:hypothetical protein
MNMLHHDMYLKMQMFRQNQPGEKITYFHTIEYSDTMSTYKLIQYIIRTENPHVPKSDRKQIFC